MRRRSQQRSLQRRLLASSRATSPLAPAGVAASTVLAVVTLSLAAMMGPGATPAAAHDDNSEAHHPCPEDLSSIPPANSEVRVVKVAGLLDPVVRDYLLRELDRAEADDNVIGYILWVNSRGSVLSDEEYVELAQRFRDSRLPIGLWVGSSGSTARGGTAELATVASLIGVTPNSTIGATGPRRLPPAWGVPFGEASERLETSTFNADQAVQAGFAVGPVSNTVPVASFAANLGQFEVYRCLADGSVVTVPQTRTLISGLPLVSQLFHTVASPEVAYLFFTMGLAILVFELFVAGVGVAGSIGAALVALGGYGFGVLPTRWWAIVLLLVSMLFLAIDVQTNVPRFYTVLGLACFVAGTWFLYDGVTMSWITGLAVIIGMILYAYTGMPSMVRTRFSTPTIGRHWIIGEAGEAITDIDPEGTVRIRDVPWRAVTNRATPVRQGGAIRVVGIDRLLLEIEPEEGGARDYRQRG